MPAVYCILLRAVHFPSWELSKVSITQLNCFIFRTGFTPYLSYYWFRLLFKTENIFMHIFSQLEWIPSMALFKSKLHNNQNDPVLNYPDFSVWQKVSEDASSADKKKRHLGHLFCEIKKTESDEAVSVYSGASAMKTESMEARIKCSGWKGVKLCRGWRYPPHASTQLLLVLWMACNHH